MPNPLKIWKVKKDIILFYVVGHQCEVRSKKSWWLWWWASVDDGWWWWGWCGCVDADDGGGGGPVADAGCGGGGGPNENPFVAENGLDANADAIDDGWCGWCGWWGWWCGLLVKWW